MSVQLESINLTSSLPDPVDRQRQAFAINVRNLLSDDECMSLISKAEHVGFSSQLEQDRTLRQGCRCMIDDHQIATLLFERLKDLIPTTWIPGHCARGLVNTHLCKIQHSNGLKLVLSGVNERMRLLRYSSGNFFHAHIDGFYIRPNQNSHPNATIYSERGVITIQIYLTSNYIGGTTRFVHPDCPSVRRYGYCNGVPKCDSNLCLDPPYRSNGDAIVFQHDIAHQGSPVRDGIKFTCRTELMFTPQLDKEDVND